MPRRTISRLHASLAGAALIAAFALVAPHTSARAAAPWQPEAPSYAVYEVDNVPITSWDGTVLRANIGLPAPMGTADPISGKAPAPASGRFPTLLLQTPYRKDGGLFTLDKYFIQRGYAYVIVDVRGTGSSDGTWDSFGAAEQEDGPAVVRWIAKQSWANGSVGLLGASYAAINQLLTMEQPDAPSQVKAIFPVVPMSDAYRDVTYHGGNLDAAFITPWLGLTTSLGLPPGNQTFDGNPDDFVDGVEVMLQHGGDVTSFQSEATIGATTGQAKYAYDGPFSQLRSPLWRIDRVRAPAFVVGGEFDIFQRGEPMLWNALPSSSKRLIIGPWIHLEGSTAAGLPRDGIADLKTQQLQWFDQYVRGMDTGENQAPRVLQYELKGTDASHFVASQSYPLTDVGAVPLYFDGGPSGSAQSLNDGALTTAPPAAAGSDMLPFTTGTPCTRTTFQWGDASTSPSQTGFDTNFPCETDERVNETTQLTYTTPALQQPVTINGPINVHVVAENPQGRNPMITVRLTDVAPDGTSTQISAGWLQLSLGAEQAMAPVTLQSNGLLLRVFHPFTPDSEKTPATGAAAYDVEVFPTFETFQAGHRIRVDVGTADEPHLGPSAPHLAGAAGTVLVVDRGGAQQSWVALPVISDAHHPCGICPTSSVNAASRTAASGSVHAASTGTAAITSLPNTSRASGAAGGVAAALVCIAGTALVAARRRRVSSPG